MNEGLKMEDSDNQKYCLKWNNFQNNFMSQFEALKEDEDFVDVTLSCYGQSIKAHKVVLSACSPYLKNIFKEHPCKHPIVILDNLSFNNLEAVIQFVYTGQVYVDQTELTSFLRAAESLQIRGLSQSSPDQNLADNNLPPVQETESMSVVSKKREADVEIKKLSNKRVARKVASGALKEESETKSKEKDYFSNIEEKAEDNYKNSSQNVMCETEQNFSIEEKNLTVSSGDEDYSAGESKKLHWLDPRSCPLCNRVYSNLSNLRQHMKLIHNPTVVTCSLCYKTFKTDLYLRRHLISFHELNLNGNNFASIDPYKPVRSETPPWNPNPVKTEPESFSEIFNGDEMYHVPQ